MKKILLVAVLIIALLIIFSIAQNQTSQPSSDGHIELGYIIYDPLMVRDSETGDLSGISYEIVNAVANEMGVTVSWVEEVGWGTALEGINTGRYDVLGTQMWPNEARERVVTFSNSPMNSVVYPYVRAGDNRFSGNNLTALNNSDVKLSVLDGEMSTFIAQEDYPEADTISLPQLSSFSEVILNVVQNKADATFIELSVAEGFLANNPGTIERLGTEPIRSFGNSFAFSKDDKELLAEWDAALEVLITSGEIKQILEDNGVVTHYVIE